VNVACDRSRGTGFSLARWRLTTGPYVTEFEAATAEESGESPERSRHCEPGICLYQHMAGKSGLLPWPAAVARRVRRSNPDMPRAWIPAGRV
jgi:hypothetical protein